MRDSIVVGYRHMGIIVKDLEKSRRFYEGILGLEMVQDYTDESKYIHDLLGLYETKIQIMKLKTKDGIIIELLKYVKHPTEYSNKPFYNVGNCHVAFTVADANQMYKKLQKVGIEVISEPLLSSEKIAKVFFCIDPDGVRIELVEILEN